MKVVLETELKGVKLFKRGKVRDTYEVGGNLLMIATDRISAFDVVLPDGIPYKGIVLTQLSLFWFDRMKDIIPNHVITGNVSEFPEEVAEFSGLLRGRSILVKKAEPIPVECVVRGYLSGSAWKEYRERGRVCGIELPKGMRESEELPEPIFTPATKEEVGHDVNISEAELVGRVGKELAAELKESSIRIYERASEMARKRGLIIADTKFEFGRAGGEVILIDELLTPDSSRFWPGDSYSPGRPQPSFDKQYVRDYLESIKWNKKPPAPALPKEIVEGTSRRYVEAYERITGKKFEVI